MDRKTEKKKNTATRIGLASAAVLFLLGAVLCGYKVVDAKRQGMESEEAFEELAGFYTEIKTETAAEKTAAADKQDAEVLPVSPIKVNFEDLSGQAARGKVAAWLYCEDTVISYPVAHCDDNVYYLEHSLDGRDNAYGVVFIDCRCEEDFSSPNTILYAHHMQDGQMFHCLKNWRNIAGFYDDHPVMYINTPEQNYELVIYSTFVADAESMALKTDFANDEEFREYLDYTVTNNVMKTDLELPTPTTEDHVVTLCTCSYEWGNAKTIVCGILRSAL